MDLLEKAKKIATRAHFGQQRRHGEPYINHPLRVAAKFVDTDEKIIALLHDVVEDSNITLNDLLNEGFPQHIVDAIDALTKRKGETYLDFILRVVDNPFAQDVKLADIEDNLNSTNNLDNQELPIPYHKLYSEQREKYLLAAYIIRIERLGTLARLT